VSASKGSFLARVEWEGLQDDLELRGNINCAELKESVDSVKIFRDNNYNLKGLMAGTLTNPVSRDGFYRKGIPGEVITPFTVECCVHGLEHFRLDHCYLAGISHNIKCKENNQIRMTFERKLLPYRLEKRLDIDSEIEWVTEWYLNGPRAGFWYTRRTERKFSSKFERNRKQFTKRFSGGESESHALDYVFVKGNEFSFIIHKVPKGLGPTWSENIGIEYMKESGRIPTKDEREAISEIISFIFGRRLLNVGHTAFDREGNALEQVSVNPWGDNVVAICRQGGLPPIRLGAYENIQDIEPTFEQLVPRYLLLRNQLGLKEVLWRYWIADSMPLGIGLPIFANGIEILVQKWFSSNKSKTKGVYLPKKEFAKVLGKAVTDIENRLSHVEYSGRIINRINNAYQMGAHERLQFFLDELGLEVGKTEMEAIRARNIMIHDTYGESDEAVEKMRQLTNAYRTFFNRVILQVLSHDGSYVDYSVLGWPEKPISQIAGPSSD